MQMFRLAALTEPDRIILMGRLKPQAFRPEEIVSSHDTPVKQMLAQPFYPLVCLLFLPGHVLNIASHSSGKGFDRIGEWHFGNTSALSHQTNGHINEPTPYGKR